MRGFRFRSILYGEQCAQICQICLSKFKCLAAKHSCCFFLGNYFLVTCPRLDPNDGITARGCAWMSPEETVVVFVQCFSIDVAKTSISNFGRAGTAFSDKLHKTGPFCSSAATLARFFHVEFEISWLVGESNTKFARHIACCAWSAVKWITRQV